MSKQTGSQRNGAVAATRQQNIGFLVAGCLFHRRHELIPRTEPDLERMPCRFEDVFHLVGERTRVEVSERSSIAVENGQNMHCGLPEGFAAVGL